MKKLVSSTGSEFEQFVPKYVRLRLALRSDISTLSPGQQLPSVAALRSRHRVSQSTFDRALESLRTDGIVETLQGKGMFVTALAKTRRVGLVFGSDIFGRGQMSSQLLLAGLQRRSRQHKSHLYYFFEKDLSSNPHGVGQLDLEVRSGRLDGLLASSGSGVWQDGWDHLMSYGLPLVAFAHRGRHPNRVCTDIVSMIRMGTQSLLKQGCQSLALWHRNPYQATEKAAAFEDTLAAAGARSRPAWNVIVPDHGPADSVAEEFFKQQWTAWGEKPDGIVCGDDVMTQGVLRAMSQLGLTVGRDLQMASHANKGSDLWGAAAVTRIEFDLDEIAEAMLQRLDELMAGEHPEPDVLSIAPHLVAQPGTNGQTGDKSRVSDEAEEEDR